MNKIFIIIFLTIFNLNCSAQENPFDERVNQGKLSSKDLNEASGIAASKLNPGVLWSHNDSGDKSRIFAVSINGQILGKLSLTGIKANDWEDICIGPGPSDSQDYIYIGEIGDNDEKITVKSIIRLKEPKIELIDGKYEVETSDFDVIYFKYPDKPLDSEALMIDPITKDLFVVSKRTDFAEVYNIPNPQISSDTLTAVKVATLNIGEAKTNNMFSRVCASDISKDGSEILIKNYDSIYYYPRHSGQSIAEALSKDFMAVKYTMEPQGEGICFDSDGSGFFTLSEESPLRLQQYLYYYPKHKTDIIELSRADELMIEVEQRKNTIKIKLESINATDYEVNLIASKGHITEHHLKFSAKKGRNSFEMPIDSIASGIYFLTFKSNDTIFSKKIAIIK